MGEYEKDLEDIWRYVERFGPLPDFRSMHPDQLPLVMDKIRAALIRGEALTDEEWGVPTDVPTEAAI